MQRDPRAFLWDVRESALAIQAFTQGMDAAGYAKVNTLTVWGVVQTSLPELLACVRSLLTEAGEG